MKATGLATNNGAGQDCMFLFLTESCNQQCAHCYVSASPGKGNAMSDEVFYSALDVAHQLGVSDIRLTGGEPTIHPKFVEYVEHLFGEGKRIGLATNGIMLIKNKKYANILKIIQRVWISVYSPESEKHLKIAGKNGIQLHRVLDFVASQQVVGGGVGVSCLLTPGDMSYVETFLELCLTKGVLRVRFIPCEPEGRAIGVLKYSDVNKFMWEYMRVVDVLRRYSGSEFMKLSINNPFDIELKFSDNVRDSCLLKGRKMISITPNGSMYNCCFNVYDESQIIGKHGILADFGGLGASYVSGPNAGTNCKGLAADYWRGLDRQTICPIRSIDIHSTR